MAVVLAVAGVAGCGEPPAGVPVAPSPTSGGRLLDRDGVRTLVAPPREIVLLAEFVGELVVNDGGCLAIRSERGHVSLLVWPHGTDVLADGEVGVLTPEKKEIRVGDTFTAAGGYQDVPLWGGPEVPTDCLGGQAGVSLIDAV
ncbi:hypothetical protein AWW66_17075 [Micromonospora rosaria]|uniref:Uncharacterized protein n=1 Tax=Micromonospora rosaria TaxID=47874 RepID=A0A136PQN5_9ACTN|nr:hypothetical protein [Micromonospora rosaria]KXK60775.1 hypothetical protein AWW66_17075 [Micromonospora rosaria]